MRPRKARGPPNGERAIADEDDDALVEAGGGDACDHCTAFKPSKRVKHTLDNMVD